MYIYIYFIPNEYPTVNTLFKDASRNKCENPHTSSIIFSQKKSSAKPRMDRPPPLGSIHGMRWCGETNRYYSLGSGVSQSVQTPHSTDNIGPSYRDSRYNPIEQVRSCPVTETLLRSLTLHRKKRQRAESEDCAICLRQGIDGKADPRMRFISLPCSHSFHFYCVAGWVTKRSGSCPICRTPLDTSLAVAASSCS
jgi:hypothetical protein